MSQVAVDISECTNCGAALHGTFCARCGQKAGPPDPSVRHVVSEVWHEVVPVDGRILRSLRLLLTKPGFLTLELLRGRRASYVTPIRLYLLFSVAAFAVIALMPDREPELTAQDIEAIQEDTRQRQTERDTRREPAGRRGWSYTGTGRWSFTTGDMTPEERRRFGAEIMNQLPRTMFLLVPVFALMVGVMARKARRHYPTHLYFAMHAHAAYFALLALTTPLELVGRTADLIGTLGRPLYALVYIAVAFRRVYGYSRLSSSLRAVVLFVAYTFIVVIAFMFTAIAAFYIQQS
jgi:hypothetical protein